MPSCSLRSATRRHPALSRALAAGAVACFLATAVPLSRAAAAEDGAVSPAPTLAPATPPATASPGPVSPQRLRLWMHHADRLLLAGRADEALAPLGRITEVVPTHAGAWLMTSRALMILGRAADARDAAERAVALLQKEPADRRAAYGPGFFFLHLGKARAASADLAGAETALRAADREMPETAEVLRELGSILHRQGKDAEAVRILTRAVAADPSSGRSRVELGNALVRAGDLTAAHAAFSAAVALAPAEPEPHFGLASVARARGDAAAEESALAVFERLSQAREERMAAARTLDEGLRAAAARFEAGDFPGAAAGFEAAVALAEQAGAEGRVPLILVDAARSWDRAGDPAAARQAYERAAATGAGAREPVIPLELGTLLAARGLVDEAFPFLLRAASMSPLDPVAHARLGLTWAALGRLDDALAETAKASLLDPDDLGLRNQYLELLVAAGREDEARDLASRAGLEGAPAAPAAPAAP